MKDCRTCLHNCYLGDEAISDYVACSHPVTIRKMPQWEKGDPAFVAWRTADMHVRDIHNVRDCPTWETAS